MALRELDETDQLVVRRCIEAVLAGGVVAEEEYALRLGVSRGTLEGILEGWPPQNDGVESSDDFFAVNNCLAAIAYDPLIADEFLEKVTRDQADQVYLRWIRSVGLPDPLAGLRDKR